MKVTNAEKHIFHSYKTLFQRKYYENKKKHYITLVYVFYLNLIDSINLIKVVSILHDQKEQFWGLKRKQKCNQLSN